ncbi:MAG: hypothetical protein AB4063_06215 [Crocosphaera sp.]
MDWLSPETLVDVECDGGDGLFGFFSISIFIPDETKTLSKSPTDLN